MSVENDLSATLRAQTHQHEQIVLFEIITDPHSRSDESAVRDVVYQNTGHGWWTESTVCETLRTPTGGDSNKANLIVEEIRHER